MCGICGVAGGDPARGGELVQRMCGSMVHRGPDDEGSIHLDGVTLGMRRLSIIDIEGGHQPMSNEDSTVWVIQNGEIYNHRHLREQLLAAGHVFATKSDTEVLVHGYEEWGERMVERLNGMFAFALLDRRKASLMLARDRMGIKPLHYAVDGECARWRDALREAVRKELISDVPVGVFLSGGIDSSAVTAIMTQLGGDVRSFSVGFAEPSFDESAHARDVARHLGTDHHELTLEPAALLGLIPKLSLLLDEPLGDASIIPTYLLSAFTGQHVKVALGGDGGDELFAGYPTLQAHRLAGYYLRAPRMLRRGLVEPLVRRLPVSRSNLSFDFRAKRFVAAAGHTVAERHQRWMGSFAREERSVLLSPELRAEAAAIDGESLVAEYASIDALNQALMIDMRLYLENDILVKLDRASMMASLEGRVPLLNNDFVAYATSLPLHMKLNGLRTKFLLKRALRGILPERILNRPKKGFGIPVAEWFRGPLKEQMLSVLSPERIAREGFFDSGAVSALISEHLAGRRDNRKQ